MQECVVPIKLCAQCCGKQRDNEDDQNNHFTGQGWEEGMGDQNSGRMEFEGRILEWSSCT